MKVSVISLFHPELTPGGAQQVAYDLHNGLNELPNVTSEFLASAADSPVAETLRRPGASVTGFQGRSNEYLWWNDGMNSWLFSHRDPRPLIDFVNILAFLDPDVVSLHHFFRLGAELPALIKERTGAKIVLTLHEYLSVCAADGHLRRLTDGSVCSGPTPVKCHECIPGRSPEEFFMRERWFMDNLSAVDSFVAPSAAARDALVGAGFPFGIDVILNGSVRQSQTVGTEMPEFIDGEDQALPEDEVVFGFFGQMLDDKGISVLLDAALQLEAKRPGGWRLDLYGGNLEFASPSLQSRVAEIRSLNSPRINFMGIYDNDRVLELMARCHWIVIPARWPETFNLVLSEARLSRRPVIASAIGALKERVTHEVDGLLVRPNDASALVQGMRRAIDSRDSWSKYCDATPLVPTNEEMVTSYAGLFESLGKA